MNDQTEVSSVESSTSADHAPLPIESFFEDTTIRSVKKDGDWWFVASDIAKALEFKLTTDMVKMVEDDEKGMHRVHTLGGDQEMLLINEKGFYRAIFRSNKKSVKLFQDWVFGDLLPTLRKEGSYHMALKDVPKRLFTLDEIDTLCDKYLPPLPYQEPEQYDTDSDDWRFIVHNRIDIRTPYQKREDERRLFKTQLREICGEYMELRELYALFEANVKAAGRIIDGGEMSTAEKLVETYKAFRQRVKQTVFDLGFGPEDIPDETMAAINYERCFAEQFRKTWKAYIGDTRKDGGVTAEYGQHIWLHRIK